jgi:repressor LexA
MSIRERILQYLKYKNVTRYRFYKETGLSNGFLDKEGAIGSDNCEKICYQYPDLSADWLILGVGEMIKSAYSSNHKVKESDVYYTQVNGIPLIPISAMAGAFTGEMQVLEHECERFVIPTFKGADFLISVKGSSMNPKYNSGDIIACKRLPIDTFFQWHKVYVLDTDQGALVKRVKKGKTPDELIIVSDNPNYEPFELHRSKIYHIALVIGVVRLE